jgi:hypothetical protein
MITIGTIKGQFPVETANMNTVRVTMTLMTLMIVNIETITFRGQFTLGIASTTTIIIIMTMMTLIIDS